MKMLQKCYEDVMKKYNCSVSSYFSSKNEVQKEIYNLINDYKKGSLKISSLFADNTDNRNKHILSTFLMGVVLYDNCDLIKKSINKLLGELRGEFDENEVYDFFLFVWTLTSIYHDAGYPYEERKKQCWGEIQDYVNNSLPEDYKNVPKLYTNELLSSYAWYRFIHSGTLDHGVYGGKKFYQDLIEGIVPDNRIFTLNVYKTVSWAIACHNIWFCYNKNEEDEYKRFGLSELIKKAPVREIKLKDHPLLFLLSLVDNIEPIKRGLESYLEKIDIKFKENFMVISLQEDGQCKENFTKYKQQIMDLNNWLLGVADVRDENGNTEYHLFLDENIEKDEEMS